MTPADLALHPSCDDLPAGISAQAPAFEGKTNAGKTCFLSQLWVKINFASRQEGFYRRLQALSEGQSVNVPKGDSREKPIWFTFPTDGPKIRFPQEWHSTCLLSSLASALFALGDEAAVAHVSAFILDSVAFETHVVEAKNSQLHHAIAMLRGKFRGPGDPNLGWDNIARVKEEDFDTLRRPNSDAITICCLRNNHCITLWDQWIFDANVPHALPLEDDIWFSWCCGAHPFQHVKVADGVVTAHYCPLPDGLKRKLKRAKRKRKKTS